jgi:PKD repeat protein
MLILAGCDEDSDVNQQPDADFSFTVDGTTVTFSDQSEDPDGEIQSYDWEFGDGATSEEASPSHTYDMIDTYQVTLTVTDNGGKTDDVTKPVNLEQPAGPNYANYDTLSVGGEQVIRFEEGNNQDGVVPTATGGNENVRSNYIKWTNDFIWQIDGRTFVNEGDTLEIEPGTVVKGISNRDPTNASVLVVARGATIIADGNPGSSDPSQADPIIFTAEEDDVDDLDDVGRDLEATWGGVIILGNGPKNFPGSRNVEGIPSDVSRASFGSSSPDPNDDSGIFRFVSIRYGGVAIGAGNEINGLTMGAVGAGTTIEFVEVFNNLDDGLEWFGGNVNARYLVSSRNGDDSFDIDQGFSGTLQFLLAVQTDERGDRTGEHDSGDDAFARDEQGDGDYADRPFSNPQIYNATYIGSGPNGDGDIGLKLRENFAGNYFNSIFYDYPAEFVEIGDQVTPDARDRWEDGSLTIENSITWQFAAVQDANNPYDDLVENGGNWGAEVADSLESYGVTYENPGLSRSNLGGMDFQTVGVIPSNASVVTNNVASQPSDNDFLVPAPYKGAFDPNGGNWARGWTFTDEVGMLD